MLKKLVLLIALGCLSGCFSVAKKEVCLEKPQLIIQNTDPVELDPLKITIITKNNKDDLFTGEEVFFSLDPQSYKNLSLNLEKIKNYIIKQNKVIEQYKSYYSEK